MPTSVRKKFGKGSGNLVISRNGYRINGNSMIIDKNMDNLIKNCVKPGLSLRLNPIQPNNKTTLYKSFSKS